MLTLLPSDVQSRLRSDVAVTSVSQCVEELVLNSLDAGAVCIAIRVDLSRFTVQVVDNGKGMSRDDLNIVGQRYSTSKCHKLEDLDKLEYFGYRGEALASLRDITSALEIHSRFDQSSVTFCKIFKHGKPLAVADSKYPRPCSGSTVTAHNLFYNLPVRQQNIAEALELERIRYRVEGIALMNPSVSFSLRNDITGNIVLQTQKSNSMLTSFTYLFGGGLSKFLKPVSIEKGSFTIEGYISKDVHAKKNLQFVYVNGRLVLNTKVHKMVNKAMSSCILFKRNRKEKYNTPPNRTTVKYSDRYSIFVINVKCPYDCYDITFDPRKTLVEFRDGECLEMAVEEMVLDFLKKENLTDYGESPEASKIPESINGACANEHVIDVIDSNVLDSKSNEDAEISTFNTNNSLFSKTVQRQPAISCKPTIACENFIVNSKTPEVNVNKSPSLLPSSSQMALEDAAEKLQLQVSPVDKEFTSDDENPQKCPILKSHHEVQSSSSSDMNSSKDEDDLCELCEDPLLCIDQPVQRFVNETENESKTRIFEDDVSSKYISLPTDRKRQNSANLVPSAASDTERSMTAAEKISAKLKARKQIQSAENERVAKVSSILDKFRKKSKPDIPMMGIVQGKIGETHLISDVSHATSFIDCQRMPVQCTSVVSSASTTTVSTVTSSLSLHLHQQSEMNNQTMNSTIENRKRPKIYENHSTEPKKLRFLTSTSFFMTPKTALAELKSSSGENSKTHPSSDKNSSGEAMTVSNNNFKKPLPVEKVTLPHTISSSHDSFRTGDIFSSTLLSSSCDTCHLTKTTNASSNILPNKSSINPCDKSIVETVRESKNEKHFLSSQGFKVNSDEANDGTDVSGHCYTQSQGFDCNIGYSDANENTTHERGQSSEDFDVQYLQSEEKHDCEGEVIDSMSMKTTNDSNLESGISISNETTVIDNEIKRMRVLSPSHVDEMSAEITQLHETNTHEENLGTFSSGDSLDTIQCGQTKTTTIQSTGDSLTITDILSDASEKSDSLTTSGHMEIHESEILTNRGHMEIHESENLTNSGHFEINESENLTNSGHLEIHESDNLKCSDIRDVLEEQMYGEHQQNKTSEQFSEQCSTADDYKGPMDVNDDDKRKVGDGSEHILEELITQDDQWYEMEDSNSGKKFYLNRLTGNTIYEDEWKKIQDNRNKEEVNKQTQEVKKKTDKSLTQLNTQESDKLHELMSKHFEDNEDKYVKWRNSPSEEAGTTTSIDEMFGVWQNPVGEKVCQPGISAEIQHSSKSGLTSHQVLHQIRFTKDMLSCMQVLGQVDSKFIACVIGSPNSPACSVPKLLVMMDQHAAHERVRLEQFTSELFEDEEEDVVKRSVISPPIVLNLTADIVRVMNSFTAEFDRIGIKFSCVENSRTEVHLHTIPACIMEREANEIKRGKRSIATQFVEELVTEHVEYLKNTSGSRRRLPISLHNILATKACKGAIKFNDNLSKKQCEELIRALSKCDLPFQCAHGRPSIIPLFELEHQFKPKKEVKARPRLDRLVKAMNNMNCQNQL